jgi:hypothetical protein
MEHSTPDLLRIDAAIAAQEQLRGQLPEWIVDAAIAALRAQRNGVTAIAAGGVGVGGDNYGAINTGTIINIHGDDIDRNREVARTILAATLLSPPLDPQRKKAVAGYFRRIAKTLGEAAAALRQGSVPHGKCGEMLGYAEELPTVLGEVIGQQQAEALSRKLMESYAVEQFGSQFMHLRDAERNAKFGELDEAAGYFRAAAQSLQVRR